LWSFGIFLPVLVFCTKKNLATLKQWRKNGCNRWFSQSSERDTRAPINRAINRSNFNCLANHENCGWILTLASTRDARFLRPVLPKWKKNNIISDKPRWKCICSTNGKIPKIHHHTKFSSQGIQKWDFGYDTIPSGNPGFASPSARDFSLEKFLENTISREPFRQSNNYF
jgi:hypothetical protein